MFLEVAVIRITFSVLILHTIEVISCHLAFGPLDVHKRQPPMYLWLEGGQPKGQYSDEELSVIAGSQLSDCAYYVAAQSRVDFEGLRSRFEHCRPIFGEMKTYPLRRRSTSTSAGGYPSSCFGTSHNPRASAARHLASPCRRSFRTPHSE